MGLSKPLTKKNTFYIDTLTQRRAIRPRLINASAPILYSTHATPNITWFKKRIANNMPLCHCKTKKKKKKKKKTLHVETLKYLRCNKTTQLAGKGWSDLWKWSLLTLKAPITTAADATFFFFFVLFFCFSDKTSRDISCESSAWQTVYMKCQDLFSLKKKNWISSATNFAWRFKGYKDCDWLIDWLIRTIRKIRTKGKSNRTEKRKDKIGEDMEKHKTKYYKTKWGNSLINLPIIWTLQFERLHCEYLPPQQAWPWP